MSTPLRARPLLDEFSQEESAELAGLVAQSRAELQAGRRYPVEELLHDLEEIEAASET